MGITKRPIRWASSLRVAIVDEAFRYFNKEESAERDSEFSRRTALNVSSIDDQKNSKQVYKNFDQETDKGTSVKFGPNLGQNLVIMIAEVVCIQYGRKHPPRCKSTAR